MLISQNTLPLSETTEYSTGWDSVAFSEVRSPPDLEMAPDVMYLSPAPQSQRECGKPRPSEFGEGPSATRGPGYAKARSVMDICFECNLPRHRRPDCPHLNRITNDPAFCAWVDANFGPFEEWRQGWLKSMGRPPQKAPPNGANVTNAPANRPPSAPPGGDAQNRSDSRLRIASPNSRLATYRLSRNKTWPELRLYCAGCGSRLSSRLYLRPP